MIKDAIALVQSALDLTNSLRGIAEKSKDAETKLVIADLQLALADLKIEIARLKTESHDLREQLAKRSATPQIGEDIESRNGLYYLRQPRPGQADGPYCTRCYDADDQLILVSGLGAAFRHFGKWRCPQCKSHYH